MADVIDAIIAEALGEGPQGMAAVAHVIQQRAILEGKTPEQVINEAGQFSGVSHPGRVVAQSMKDPATRAQVQQIWDGVTSGEIPNPYPGADYFHTPQVNPDWSNSYERLGQTGNHIFYTSGRSAPAKEAPTPMAPIMRSGSSAVAAIEDAAPNQNKDGTWLAYSNQGATRNQPISSKLEQAMGFLPDLGVTMDVYSGGQPAAGEGPRVGSTRHDHGNAADVTFRKDGRVLDWNNPGDIPVLSDIVARAKAAGVTGIGAGDDYMGPGRVHIGFGNPAVWGAGGRSANAPDWLRNAYYGPTPNVAPRPPAPVMRAQAQPAKGGFWGGLTGALAMANPGNIMRAAQVNAPAIKQGIAAPLLGTVAGRTAIMRALMPSNIGAAPRIASGGVAGGTPAIAVSSAGSRPVTLMRSGTGAGGTMSSAFDNANHGGQDMSVYRANRDAIGGPITQSSIDRALSGGGTLVRRA